MMKIKDLLEHTVDNRGKTPPTTEKGHILMEINCITGNQKYPDYSMVKKYVSSETYTSWFRSGHPKKGDVLIPTVGTLNAIGFADRDGCCIAQNMIAFRANSKVCYGEYLYYLLCDPTVRKRLLQLDIGAVQPSIKVPHIKNLEVNIPCVKEQKKIVKILEDIDNKIATNTAINKNLEEQAQAIFKAWFVDFEPFGGEMPSDWRIGNAGEILEFHDAKRVPLSGSEREKMDKIYPYYGATSLMDYVDNYIFEGIYLLLGEDGTVITKDGFPVLQYVDGKFWVNNHAHILTGKLGFSVEELYLLFSLTNIKSIVTGAVQPKVSQTNLKKVTVVIPPMHILKEFDGVIQPMFEDIRNRRAENERLTAIRDTLLPRLMSGEIDVSNIEI